MTMENPAKSHTYTNQSTTVESPEPTHGTCDRQSEYISGAFVKKQNQQQHAQILGFKYYCSSTAEFAIWQFVSTTVWINT